MKKFLISDPNHKQKINDYTMTFQKKVEENPNFSFLRIDIKYEEEIGVLIIEGTRKLPYTDEEIQKIMSKNGLKSGLNISVSLIDEKLFKPNDFSFGSKIPAKK